MTDSAIRGALPAGSGVRGLVVNSGWALLAHVLSRGTQILVAMALARSLSTSAFASLGYFQLTIAVLAVYASLGIGVTASRFFAEAGSARGPLPPIGALWLGSVALAVVVALVVLATPRIWTSDGVDVPALALALGAFALALDIVPSGAVVGLERFRAGTVAAAASCSTLVVGAVVAAQLESSRVAMAAIIAAALVQAVVNSIVVIRVVGTSAILRTVRCDRRAMRDIVAFAGPMLLVSILAGSGSWLVGRVILAGSAGARGLAFYAIGMQWFALGLVLPGMVAKVTLPRIVRGAQASGTAHPANRTFLRHAVALSAGLALAIALATTMVSPWLVGLYGSGYEGDPWLMAGFMAAAVLCAPANVIGNAIVARDRQQTWLVLTVIWLGVLLLVAMACREWGAWSGIAAQAAAALVLTTLATFTARRMQLL